MEVPHDFPYTDRPWPQPERNKAAMISRLDASVGRLLRKLQDLELDQNTLVFFSSDNGPHRVGGTDPAFFRSSGPLRGIKRDLYEGGIRVPMIARWPGVISAGRTSEQAWAFWDFLPTVADLLRQPLAGRPTDGISVLPALLGKRLGKHPPFYWEFHEGGFSQAARIGAWKAIRRPGQALELYHLGKDPGEERDVAALRPREAAAMEAYLRRARTHSEHWPVPP